MKETVATFSILRAGLVGLLLTGAAGAVHAGGRTLSCPDPATLKRVATCPSEAELRYTFTGFCSSNERLYGRDTELCTSFERYRQAKDVALVESADGEFQGYLSCSISPQALQNLKPRGVAVSRKGSLTRVICSYADDVTLVHRTKSECKAMSAERCAADAQACTVSCE